MPSDTDDFAFQLTHSGVRPHVCAECKATFTQRAMLNAHMKKHAATPPASQGNCSTAAADVPFLCASCGHGFRQRSALNSHSAVCSAAAAGGAMKNNTIPGGGAMAH